MIYRFNVTWMEYDGVSVLDCEGGRELGAEKGRVRGALFENRGISSRFSLN
jgi:hypothetical protein